MCEVYGGSLLTIPDSLTQNQLRARFGSASTSARMWIGATDSAREGLWQWVTGEVCAVRLTVSRVGRVVGERQMEILLLSPVCSQNNLFFRLRSHSGTPTGIADSRVVISKIASCLTTKTPAPGPTRIAVSTNPSCARAWSARDKVTEGRVIY